MHFLFNIIHIILIIFSFYFTYRYRRSEKEIVDICSALGTQTYNFPLIPLSVI